MEKKGHFGGYAAAICILGMLCMFMYQFLYSDQINIIQSFITGGSDGWSATSTQMPLTIGSLLCIPMVLLYGLLFSKCGARRITAVCIALSALGCTGVAAANGLDVNGGAASGSYPLYFLSILVIRVSCECIPLGVFILCANWFIRNRGLFMGIPVVGIAFFRIMGTSVITNMIANRFGGDYRGLYHGIAVFMLVLAALLWFLLKDSPEEVGLYPDGRNHAPLSEESGMRVGVGSVLSSLRGWMLIAAFVAFGIVISGCTGSMAVRYMTLGGLWTWLTATRYLAIGLILCCFVSVLLGVLSDLPRAGIKLAIVMGVSVVLLVLSLWAMPVGGSTGLMFLWGVCTSFAAYGYMVMLPAAAAYAFGRRGFGTVLCIVWSSILLFNAFSATFAVSSIQSGRANLAYFVFFVFALIGMAALFVMLKTKDADAPDRIGGGKYIAAEQKAPEL